MNPRIFVVGGLLACCGMPAAPASGHEEAVPEQQALMELYFGEEQLVEAATRHPKPLSQVAENVTIVTAEEIEAMHAHTVSEVLERVPGVFVQFLGKDFASMGTPSIHGSDYEHVLVLVDGIRWNEVAGDFPRNNQIPVEIIDRIEVIKGAASSAWGSALGGVVNIITKETGTTGRPRGSALVAIGEHGTSHEHGEAAGAVGDFGYYLFAGRRDSDGIRDDRYFEDPNLFSKLSWQLPRRARLSAEFGSSQPEFEYLHLADWDYASAKDERVHWYAASLDIPLIDTVYLYVQAYGRDNKSADTGSLISTGEVTDRVSFDDDQWGVSSRLVWRRERHTLVFGAEYLDREITNRDEVNMSTSPRLSEEIFAAYVNDTVRLGDFTITPGLRYDHLSIAEDELSPSLGATWSLSGRTLLRAAVSRGFRKPTVNLKDLPPGAPPYNTPNPDMAPETTWTYQAGVESTAIPWLSSKTTFFRHQAEDVWVQAASGAWVNDGKADRTGLEAALKTAPFHGLSMGADYTFVHIDPEADQNSEDLYKAGLLFEYANKGWGLQAQLFGTYVWWGAAADEGKFDTFLWDLALFQRLWQGGPGQVSLFFKAHNLFNGSHYATQYYPNAPRWLETGLEISF